MGLRTYRIGELTASKTWCRGEESLDRPDPALVKLSFHYHACLDMVTSVRPRDPLRGVADQTLYCSG